MKNPSWIDRATACAKLGVKPQTLYAYVGRKHVRVKPDTRDARRSLYALSDIEALATQSKRPRARLDVAASAVRWGDPILQTSITEVRAGMLWLRSLPVSDCAERMTHEQVTAHLCDRAVAYHDDAQSEVTGRTPFARAMKFLALETDTDVSRDDSENLGGIISGVTNACLGRREDGLIHERLARAWALDAAGSDLIRRALVLLSDHELNPSTFAVRVCAGTGASLPAALLAGMATLSGPKHGGVAALTGAALMAAQTGRAKEFVEARKATPPYSYGFGHPLYPDGDPRADHILRRLPKNGQARTAVRAFTTLLNIPPNIDMALAAMVRHLGCPAHAAQTVFAVARTAGWCAHALEQRESGEMIRPRAQFVP